MMQKNIKFSILSIPRTYKRIFVILIDLKLSLLAVYFAYYLRIGEFIPLWEQYNEHNPLPASILSIVTAFLIFNIFNLYNVIFRYSNSLSIITISKAFAVYSFLYISILTVIGIDGVPRTIGIIQPLIFFLLVILSRFFAFFLFENLSKDQLTLNKKKHVLIYGAGDIGYQLAKNLYKNNIINVVGYLDNNKTLQGSFINNLPIYNPNDIDRLINRLNIKEIILAISQNNPDTCKDIIEKFRGKKLTFRILPSYEDIIQEKINASDIRNLSIDDILGRKTVMPQTQLMQHDITSKIVLVTGAGGSIGSELCRQICLQKPTKLILLDRSEFGLYSIIEELKIFFNDSNVELIPYLCSITDRVEIEKLLKTFKPDTVFHTAAYKHVSLVEKNKVEGLKNNIFGTLTLSLAAIKTNVKKFVLISTDKAVRPSNIMGVSKRIAEMTLQALSTKQNKTLFAIVRFGNVLGSSGSVVPLFKSQINKGGPVTVTHPEVTRYFMTIKEAAQLTIQAGAMTKKNLKISETAPIFVLEMGSQIKILELAKLMIQLSGSTVFDKNTNTGDIEIVFSGLGPGEKLSEELIIGDSVNDTIHPKIKCADEEFLPWPKLKVGISKLKNAIKINNEKVIMLTLKELVSEYKTDY